MKTINTIDELTSTERLLDVIRGKNGHVSTAPGQSTQPERNGGLSKGNPVLTKFKAADKSAIVGIDIGHNHIHIVKTAKSDRRRVITEARSIALPSGIKERPDEFRRFFQAAVLPFCSAKTEIWAIMSAANVEVRNIRIPRVSEDRIEKTVYWTLKKEASFNEQGSFLDFVVLEGIREAVDNKLDILCYTAPNEEVEALKKLFSGTGVQLTGVSIVPFTVQNIFKNNLVTPLKNIIACLFIGNNYSRIDLYVGGKLVLTRDIKTGINSMVDILMDEIKGLPDKDWNMTAEEARKLIFAYAEGCNDYVALSCPVTDRDKIEEIITPVLERIARQMERTFEHFASALGYGDRIDKLCISGAMPVSIAIVEYFSRQLGLECEIFDLLQQVMETKSLRERTSFIPAFGIALSDNSYTPNFIYSCKDKRKAYDISKTNRKILICFIALMLVSLVIFVFQHRSVSRVKAELGRLELQLQQKTPLLRKETILPMLSAARQKNMRYAELSRRYEGMAIIGELTSLTPEAVSLTSLRADLSRGNGNSGSAVKKDKTALIEGVISGNRDGLETMLATYIMRLKSSPVFSDIDVSSSKVEQTKRGPVLSFAVNMKVGTAK